MMMVLLGSTLQRLLPLPLLLLLLLPVLLLSFSDDEITRRVAVVALAPDIGRRKMTLGTRTTLMPNFCRRVRTVEDVDDDDDDATSSTGGGGGGGRRRHLIASITGAGSLAGLTAAAYVASGRRPDTANAAETVGKDPNCFDGTCLGVWDGLLADCPHGGGGAAFTGGAGCVSSQDDTPGVFSEPWDYSESSELDWEKQMSSLVDYLLLSSTSEQRRQQKRGGGDVDDVDILIRDGRYLRVLFTDGRSGDRSIGEFYFTPSDTTVQFRIASAPGGGLVTRGPPGIAVVRNMDRAERIRKRMRYLKLPVLRDRRRSFFFGESDFDTFGPGSAALGPPAEMKTGELEGRQDVDPQLKIDPLQNFPFKS